MSDTNWISELKFQVKELRIFIGVIANTKQGYSLKPLKQLRSLRKSLNLAVGEVPKRPELPEPKDGKTYNEEENKTHNSTMENWKKQLSAFESKDANFKLNVEDYGFVKKLITSFNNFNSSEEITDLVCGLAEKLRI